MGNTQKVTGNTSGGDAPSSGVPSLYDQWRAHQQAQPNSGTEPTLVELPSGLRVRARRPNLLSLLRAGRIPDALTSRVQDLIATAQRTGEDGVKAQMTSEQADNPAEFYATWTRLLDTVWLEAVVEPTFAAEEAADAIPVAAVSDADKTFLFMWAQGVDQTVADFLDGNARAATPVGDPPLGD